MTSTADRCRGRRTLGAVIAAGVAAATIATGATAAAVRADAAPNGGLDALRQAATTAAAPPGADRAVFQAGVEAYLWGSPLVVMARTRATLVCASGVDTFLNQPGLAGPTSRLVVTPNTDTLYSSAWLDLRSGPVILHVPALAGRYYAFQLLDMFTNTFANVGTRTIGSGPAAVAIARAGWKGRLPAGTRRIDAPTPDVWVIGRTLPKNDADVADVVALQRSYTLTPIGTRNAATAPGRPVCGRPGPTAVSAAGPAYFDELGDALAADPAPAGDAAVLHDLRAGGIGAGLHPSVGATPAVLAALGQSIPAASAIIATSAARNVTAVNGWSQIQHLGTYGQDYLTRAAVAQTALGANVPAESVYYSTGADMTGTPLAGTRPVVIHFAAGQLPPVDRPGFWSVTLYGPDHFLVANPISRYAIGDRTRGLQPGGDGSLDLVVAAQSPPGQAANWLPAPPGRYSLVLRAYLPGSSIRRGTWRPPTIRMTAS